MARDIDRKLRLTAAVLGTITRKDLAAQFRLINPATTFDVERAQKWLQGRARPRERQVYEDWARLLDLGRSGHWIAECDVDAFVDALCSRHGHNRDGLLRQANGIARAPKATDADPSTNPIAGLAGTYLSYSHAWSRYFRGQLICGELSFRIEPRLPRLDPQRQLAATYVQNLPTGATHAHGAVSASRRTLGVDLHSADIDEPYNMRLFRPAPPASVLAGFFTGPTFLSSETELTTTRVVLIRLPSTISRRSAAAYLPPGASVAADLSTVGLPLRDPAEIDRQLSAFLEVERGGIDQLGSERYEALTALFDRNWLSEVARTTV